MILGNNGSTSGSLTIRSSGRWVTRRCPSQAQVACPERTPSAAEGELKGFAKLIPYAAKKELLF